MPRTRTYTPDFLNNLRQKLEAAPIPTRSLCSREAIDILKNELTKKRNAGWTLKELATWLTEQDLVIDAGSLSGYLQDGRRTKTRKTEKAKSTKTAMAVETIRKVPSTETAPPAATTANRTGTVSRRVPQAKDNGDQKKLDFANPDSAESN
ncbi:hypothetical protein [Azospirillum endophyticum]